VAVLSIALGIGANTAIFTLLSMPDAFFGLLTVRAFCAEDPLSHLF
jgi:hypothetical protein